MNKRGCSWEGHRTIIDKMLNAFALHEIICDSTGKPVDYRFLELNPAFETLTGLRKEKILNKTILEVLPGTEKYWIDTYGKIALEGASKRFQNYSKELKKYFDVFAFSPEKGKFACIFNDITDLKLHESELLKYKTLFDNANIGISIIDKSGKILLVNDYFARVHGYAPQDIHEKHYSIFLSDEQIKKVEALHATALKNGQFKTEEVYHKRKNGENFPMLENGIRLQDNNDNSSPHIAITALDITDQKLAMMQAEEHKNKLLQADKMASLGILVAGVAHEINNPNNSIMLNVPILQNLLESALPLLDEKFEKEGDFKVGKIPYSALRPEVQSLIKGTIESSIRIKTIVNDLKDYAKDSSDSELEDLNVNEVINSSLALLKSMLKKQVNKLECSLPEGLPAVTGSYQKLEQVIVNLIQNACESKDGKKVNLEIKTCFNQEKNSLEISIKDNGDGIAATKLKYILDPFFTTKRANGGTGLGLSVSMGILKEFKGEMHVDSTEGKGSTFTVSIPLK